jgi:integrase
MAQTLTPKRVEKIAPGPTRKEVPDGGQTGLYLIVQPSGARSWGVRYRHHGRPRKATLGAFPAIDLPQARKLAQAALRDASEGKDPAGEKVAKRNGTTVGAVWEEYRDLHMAQRRDATAAAAKTLFTNTVLPKWGKLGIETIRRRDVMNLLDDMRGEPAKANKAKVRLNHFFGWCVEREIIPGSPVASVKTPHKPKSRARVLTDEELRRIWKAADEAAYPFGPLVKILILTMARRTEVAAMAWGELNGQEQLWTIPEDRTKNGIAIDVHRTATMNAILEGVPRAGDYVFTTRENRPVSGFAKMKARLDELTGDGVAPWTLHDLRRTGSTIMQRLAIRKEVIDAAQNHKMPGISATYLRYGYAAEKVKAFEALEREVLRIVTGAAHSNVIPLIR